MSLLRAIAEWGLKYELTDEQRSDPRVIEGRALFDVPEPLQPAEA